MTTQQLQDEARDALLRAAKKYADFAHGALDVREVEQRTPQLEAATRAYLAATGQSLIDAALVADLVQVIHDAMRVGIDVPPDPGSR